MKESKPASVGNRKKHAVTQGLNYRPLLMFLLSSLTALHSIVNIYNKKIVINTNRDAKQCVCLCHATDACSMKALWSLFHIYTSFLFFYYYSIDVSVWAVRATYNVASRMLAGVCWELVMHCAGNTCWSRARCAYIYLVLYRNIMVGWIVWLLVRVHPKDVDGIEERYEKWKSGQSGKSRPWATNS